MEKGGKQRLFYSQKNSEKLFFDKKGITNIIIAFFILILASVGVLWVVVHNVLEEGVSDTSLGAFRINLKIESVKVIDDVVKIRVKRNAGEANLIGISFILSDGENTEIFEEDTDMDELETRTFNIKYSGILKSVEIAPILEASNGKRKIYDPINKYEVEN